MDRSIKIEKAKIIFFIMIMFPLGGIGIDLYTPSLPAIVTFFQTNTSLVQITLPIYLLGYGIGQPVFGSLSDTIGRKLPLILGMVFYVLFTYLCGYSQTIEQLIGFRFLQGIAVASGMVIARAMITDSFVGKRLIKVSTWGTIAWAIGPIIAPAIGGYIQAYFGWQTNFTLLFIYGLAVILYVTFLLHETHKDREKFHFGKLLRVYKSVLSHKSFCGGVIMMALTYSLIILFNVVAPFMLQTYLAYTPVGYGHIAFVMGFAFFLGTSTNRVLVHNFSIWQILPVAIYIWLAASIGMLIWGSIFVLSVYSLTVPTFIIIYASGLVFPNCLGNCLSLFPKNAGSASAIIGMMFVIGTSLMGTIGSFLESDSVVPIGICYLAFAIISIFSYYFLLASER